MLIFIIIVLLCCLSIHMLLSAVSICVDGSCWFFGEVGILNWSLGVRGVFILILFSGGRKFRGVLGVGGNREIQVV